MVSNKSVTWYQYQVVTVWSRVSASHVTCVRSHVICAGHRATLVLPQPATGERTGYQMDINATLNIYKSFNQQWRIQDFSEGGAPTLKLGLFCQFCKFAENCMKMKEFRPRGAVPWGSPLDPPILSVHGLWNLICIFSSRGYMSNQWRIYIVNFWTRAPSSGSTFFQFDAVFGKIWQNGMLASPGGLAPPPRRNPGSATANYSFLKMLGQKDEML